MVLTILPLHADRIRLHPVCFAMLTESSALASLAGRATA